MANVKISALPAASLPLAGTEVTPSVQGGVTVKAPASAYGPPAFAIAAQGDVFYGSATGVVSSLPKSITATRYLANTGASNNPAWAQVSLTNGITGTLPIANGGTGATTANDALNALLPDQSTHAGQFLTTDGSTTSWASAGGSSVQIAYCRSNEFGDIQGTSQGISGIVWDCGTPGTYEVDFTTDYFATAPSVTVTTLLGSPLSTPYIVSVSATNVVIRTVNSSGSDLQRGFHLHAMGIAGP